jgi:hypothetical protein
VSPDCRKPFLHGNGTDIVAVFESTSNGNISTVSLDAMANGSVIATSSRTLGTGSDPRVFAINGQRWAAWRDNSRLHMSPTAIATDVPIVNAPSGPPDAYEPAGPYLFAVWRSELWAITCP